MFPALHVKLQWERSCLSPFNNVSYKVFPEQRRAPKGFIQRTLRKVKFFFLLFLTYAFFSRKIMIFGEEIWGKILV